MATVPKPSNHFIVILCGGTGPRLWPMSRASNPKQFLNLFSDLSLLQQTYHRALRIVPQNNIYIVTNQKYSSQIKSQLPDIHLSHILSEPDKKNTLMAITYASAVIHSSNPNAVISSFPSDHFIAKNVIFRKQIKTAMSTAESTSSIVLIGIKPGSPNPSYGYLIPESRSTKKYLKINKFTEKPDTKTAQKLIQSKALWNSGIYTFSSKTFFLELQKHQPLFAQLFQKICNDPGNQKIISKVYQLAPNLAIDIAISQVSRNLIAHVSKFIWSDVGEWKTIFAQLKKDKNNIASMDKSVYYSVNSQDCLIKSSTGKLIGLVGVQNLAVIDTPDGLLVCNMDASFNVRDLVSLIVKSKETQHFFLS